MKNVKLYGDIAKSEDQDDGTVKVWGYASSNAVDSDGEQITSDAMRAALPDYMKFANVREMHTAKAAGIAIEAEVQEDGRTFFGAHIIDSEAVKKVRAGVYKGFSIGGKVLSRNLVNKSIINGLRLSEVSLVDRPANPEAVFNFFKAEGLDGADGEEDGRNNDKTQKVDDATVAPTVETVTITKAEADEFAAYKAEKAANAKAELMKSMSSVSQLAYILRDMSWLVQDGQYEVANGGRDPAVLERMTEATKEIGAILVAMTVDEVKAMADRISPPDDGTAIALAVTPDDLAKAGAKFSGATKKALGDAHSAMKQACSHLDGLGYTGKADDAEDLAKMESLTNDLAKMTGERDELAKQVAAFKALPAPTKTTLKVVEKAQDISDPLAKSADDDTPKTPEQIMKSIHSGGAMVMTASGLRPLS